MVRDKELALLAARALAAVAPPLKDVADASGISYGTAKAWRAGIRTPSAENLEKLAEVLDGRADVLRGLALELRRAANDSRSGDS